MFGIFRFVMALLVLVTHIGGIEVAAGIAVWGFYMLSGFLMTGVLNRRYGFKRKGLTRYAASRAVRLFPTYWVSIAITALFLYFVHGSVSPTAVNSGLALPQTLHEHISGLFIVGSTTFGLGRLAHSLSPASWAVDIEILMYICSCIFLSRSERIAKYTSIILIAAFPLLWLAAKMLMARGDMTLANEVVYSFLPAALLPYALGCWLWFTRERIPSYLSNDLTAVLASAGIVACFLVIRHFSVTGAYILSLPLLGIIIHRCSKFSFSGHLRGADDILGRMSYPIYLMHWFCAYLVALVGARGLTLTWYLGDEVRFNLAGFFAVTALVCIVGFVFAVGLEGPVERFRNRFKHGRKGEAVSDPPGI